MSNTKNKGQPEKQQSIKQSIVNMIVVIHNCCETNDNSNYIISIFEFLKTDWFPFVEYYMFYSLSITEKYKLVIKMEDLYLFINFLHVLSLFCLKDITD